MGIHCGYALVLSKGLALVVAANVLVDGKGYVEHGIAAAIVFACDLYVAVYVELTALNVVVEHGVDLAQYIGFCSIVLVQEGGHGRRDVGADLAFVAIGKTIEEVCQHLGDLLTIGFCYFLFAQTALCYRGF